MNCPADQIIITCAIDHGNFTYNRMRQGQYTNRSFFYGTTNLSTYLGNEDFKRTPGFCRILAKDFIIPPNMLNQTPGNYFTKVRLLRYNWMLNDLRTLERFKKRLRVKTLALALNLVYGTFVW